MPEHFSRLNKEIQILSDALYSAKGDTPEEEAGICLALLMGYSATIYSDKDKEAKKQSILDRAWEVLEQLPPSLLKCQLLTYCYGEVFEDELAQEAHAIIDSWQGRELTAKMSKRLLRIFGIWRKINIHIVILNNGSALFFYKYKLRIS